MPLTPIPVRVAGDGGHVSNDHPIIHDVVNSIINAQDAAGPVFFGNANGDVSSDVADFFYTVGTNTLTVTNLAVTGGFSGGIPSGMTAGSVLFAGATGLVAQDNANFFYDDPNNRVGLGTTTPVATIDMAERVGNEPYLFVGDPTLGVAPTLLGAGFQTVYATFVRANTDVTTFARYDYITASGAFPSRALTGLTSTVALSSDSRLQVAGTNLGALVEGGASTGTAVGNTGFVQLQTGGILTSAAYGSDSVINVFSATTAPVLTGASLYGARSRIHYTGTNAVSPATVYGHYIETPTAGTFTPTTSYGLYVRGITTGTSAYGIAVGASTTQTLWVGHLADSTTAAAGIGFGSSRDTVIYRGAAAQLNVTGSVVPSGVILAPDGSVTNPSYSFVNSTGTGLLRSGADILGFATAGVQRAQINATGHVQIGGTVSGDSWVVIGGGNTHPSTSIGLQGLDVDWTSPATATSTHVGIRSKVRTTAAAYTASLVRGIQVQPPTLGAGSAITLNRGIDVSNQGATGVASGTGVYVQAQSGASSSNYGIQIEAATTATLLVSANADNTTAAAGIAFGASRDTVLYRGAANRLETTDTFMTSQSMGLGGQTPYVGQSILGLIPHPAPSGSVSVANTAINIVATATNFAVAQSGDYNVVLVGTNTVTASAASTIADFSGLRVQGPVPSTNVTATRSQAVLVQTGANANVGIDIRANSGSQSGNLMRFSDSAGTTIFALVSASGQFFAADGTSSAPGLGFRNSTTTGFSAATSNTLVASTAGVERWRTTAEGAFLLGVQTNAAMWLRVGGGGNHPDTTSATTTYGIDVDYAGLATATSVQYGIRSRMRTAASAYTLADLRSLAAAAPSYGAGSTTTQSHGLFVENHGAAGATTAYGVRINGQTGSTSNIGFRVDASTLVTLWVGGGANDTTAQAGIMFGSSRDTVLYRGAADQLKTDDVFNLNNAGGLLVQGTKVVGAQGAAVADAAGGAIIDAEARTAINDLLARLRTHGLIAT